MREEKKQHFCNSFLFSVSLDDISAVRVGRQTEGLRKSTEEQVEDRCFSIVFKGRRKNLDLIASSDGEAKQWVSSLQKLVSNVNNLSRRQKTEQYPSQVARLDDVSTRPLVLSDLENFPYTENLSAGS